MHSLTSQTVSGHSSLIKTFPTYAFLWNIHLYQKYIFLFCPFFLIGFGPYFGLFRPFLVFIQFVFQICEEEYTLLNEFCTWLSYFDETAYRGWSGVRAAVSNI